MTKQIPDIDLPDPDVAYKEAIEIEDSMTKAEPHHVETFIADEFVSGKHNYGWQCFTKGCLVEEADYSSFAEAEKAGEEHVAEVSA